MCGYPADGYLVATCEHSLTDLHHCDGETLARALGPQLVGGGGRVDEDRLAVAALLGLVHNCKPGAYTGG